MSGVSPEVYFVPKIHQKTYPISPIVIFVGSQKITLLNN